MQFRGNDANGVTADSAPEDLKTIAWSVELEGRGLSGPIIVGDQVFITSSSGYRQDRLHVLSFDRQSGEKLWERQFWATGQTGCHQKMCVATPPPASDGQRVFAFYSSNDLACLDLDGNLLWYRGLGYDFPNASNSLGMSSSPVVVGDTVVVQVESDAEAFAMGLDVATGIARWKIERPRAANWTSPALLPGSNGNGQRLVLLQSTKGLQAIEPATGRVVWEYNDAASTIPSATVADDRLYIPSNGITALKPVSQESTPELLWQDERLKPSTASPLAYNGKVYTVDRAGVLTCANGETSKTEWRLRLKGPFSGTPIAAGGFLYLFSEKGLGQVVDVREEKGKLADSRELEDVILCTPAISDGGLFVRSDQHLWKFSAAN